MLIWLRKEVREMKYRSIMPWDEEHQRKAGVALFVFLTGFFAIFILLLQDRSFVNAFSVALLLDIRCLH